MKRIDKYLQGAKGASSEFIEFLYDTIKQERDADTVINKLFSYLDEEDDKRLYTQYKECKDCKYSLFVDSVGSLCYRGHECIHEHRYVCEDFEEE